MLSIGSGWMPAVRLGSLGFALLVAMACSAAPLPQLVIDRAQTTVSGLSSGGYMAVQMHVAYSATFATGAGIVAGGPYYCAEGSLLNATGRCMAHSSSIPVASLAATTRSWASSGLIDPVSNLAGSKVWLFSGTLDSTVVPAVMTDLKSYYEQFVPASGVLLKSDLPAEHGMVTDDHGNACATKASPYINDCDYDAAGAMLAHLYGPLNPRNDGALGGRFVEFEQGPFGGGTGMAATGWVYVPAACEAGDGTRCRLHVAFHGCRQNTAAVGQEFVRSTGYNRWADRNAIVVLYPQTSSSAVNGCWDWWGYDHPNYAQRSGPQMAAVKAMVDRLSSGAPPSALPPPAGVGTSGATETSMVVSWSAVEGASGYHVYRDGSRVTPGPVAGTSHTDSGLRPGTTYQWTVTSVDAAGAESVPSAPASGSTAGSDEACFTASNVAHVAAGRAYVSWGFLVYARGSNQAMGFWNIVTTRTLKRTAPDHYVIGSCP